MPRGASERRRRNRSGHSAEFIAAAYLIARGYSILARRYKTRSGEIDLIASRRGRIAFIEVKRRGTRQDCEAAITENLARRVRAAADQWLAAHPGRQSATIGFDLVFVTPWRLPHYMPDAL